MKNKRENGVLISQEKARKVIQFYRVEKKIKIGAQDDQVYNLTTIFESETQDIYSITENNDINVRFLYHFKPKNILIYTEYLGLDVLGVASVSYKVDPFYCANTNAIKK